MDKIEKARQFAITAHKDQMYGEYPYIKHLSDVVGVLRRFGYDDEINVCCAFLHDTLEDTDVTYDDIKNMFGVVIAINVYLVTNEKGRNREERAAKTLPLIKGHKRATQIKLADRIANVESSIGTSFMSMYSKERHKFEGYLYVDGELEEMWHYLDNLFAENRE
jgi:(p)ppGpp synthase/HD superfamily hydrolase